MENSSSISENPFDFPSLATSNESNPPPLPKPSISYSDLIKKSSPNPSFSSRISSSSHSIPIESSSVIPSSLNASTSDSNRPEKGILFQQSKVPNLSNSDGLKTLVVDANAIIKGIRLERFNADEVFTVPEVLNEIKDENSRRILSTLPYDIICREPTEESIKAVMRFAKETGDMHSLSAPDVKLIALAYTLEEARHGSFHLRKRPPPLIQLASSKPIDQTNMPGWGKVENPEEWAEIDQVQDDGTRKGEKASSGGREDGRRSKILGLTTIDLSQGLVESEEEDDVREEGKEDATTTTNLLNGLDGKKDVIETNKGMEDFASRVKETNNGDEGIHEMDSFLQKHEASIAPDSPEVVDEEKEDSGFSVTERKAGDRRRGGKGRRKKGGKKIVLIHGEENFEGKVSVAGVDASKGEHSEDEGEWEKAGGKSLRRKTAKREKKKAVQMQWNRMDSKVVKEEKNENEKEKGKEEGEALGGKENDSTHPSLDLRLCSLKENENERENKLNEEGRRDENENDLNEEEENKGDVFEHAQERKNGQASESACEKDEDGEGEEGKGEGEEEEGFSDRDEDGQDVEDQNGDKDNESTLLSEYSRADVDSESSFQINELSESSVACITSDFAMQNVIMQMGLRLLTVDGLKIKKLQKFVLKCHACQAVTVEIGKIFCPVCGNGGTLNKVAVAITENGIVFQNPRKKFSLRGTKFNLPAPLGGREASEKKLILREDQLPKNFLKKKSSKNNIDSEYDSWFQGSGIKPKSSKDEIKGVVPFLSKRNPNENRVGRRK